MRLRAAAAVAGTGLLLLGGAPARSTDATASQHPASRADHHTQPAVTSTPTRSPAPGPTSPSTPGRADRAPATVLTVAPTRVTGPRTVATPPAAAHQTPSAELAGFFAPAFAGRSFCTFGSQVATISGGVLVVDYPAGSSAPSAGAPYGGAQICIPFAGGSRSDATLSYSVRFPVGFEFVKGGKLPGLYGGAEPFSGGGHNASGWSMRLMWRAGGAAEVYGYISTTSGYGDDWGRGNFTFQADGQWHTLTEHIHLNTPGRSDGYVTLAYDGVVRIQQSALAITVNGTPIGGLFFSTFYGGHDASWAPSAPMHIDFARFSAR